MSEFQKAAVVARQAAHRVDDRPAELRVGWSQALERSREDIAEGRFVEAVASQAAARKDFEEFFSPPADVPKF